MLALALAGLVVLSAPAVSARALKQASSGITDADILNFALNLECLEAQFYSCAVFGHPLSDELTGYGPAPIGCQQANFTNDDINSLAMDVANNEIAHVSFLRSALGNSSVQCPLVNIGSAFSDAANAVLGTTLSPPFSPYVNDLFFLHGAYIFEDLGVTAYKGAAPLIQSSDILSAAAGMPFVLLLILISVRCQSTDLVSVHDCPCSCAEHAYFLLTFAQAAAHTCRISLNCKLMLC